MRNRKKHITLFVKTVSMLMTICIPSFIQAGPMRTESLVPDLLNNNTFYLIAFSVIILLAVIIGLVRINIGLGKGLRTAMKRTAPTILLVFIFLNGFSQDPSLQIQKSELPEWAMNSNLYAFGFLFLIMLITIYVLISVNRKLIKAFSPQSTNEDLERNTVTVQKSSLIREIYLRLVDSVPVAEEKDVMLDHDYDGIKELDNNLPPWWKYGFYITIVFAFAYMIVYHIAGNGDVQLKEYRAELILAEHEKLERLRLSAENITEVNVRLLSDKDAIIKGKENFIKLCAPCHRADGGGQVGPNLTDEFWLHGGGIKNVFSVIKEGVPSKGMISWKSQLSPKQIQEVASFILTLKGTNPTGPKEPQGDKWVEENTTQLDSLVSDSTRKPLAEYKKTGENQIR